MIFEFNCCNDFDAFEAFLLSSKHLTNLCFILNSIFIEFNDFSDRLTLFRRNESRYNEKSMLKKILNFQLNNIFFLQFNLITRSSTLFKSLNKIKISTNIVIIDVIVFYKLNFRKNKATDVKCYLIIIFEINNILSIYHVQNN